MVIIGALGLATDVLQILIDKGEDEDLYFYDDVNGNEQDMFFDRYPIIRTEEQLAEIFNVDPRFILAVGSPQLRSQLSAKFIKLGGIPVNCISPFSRISPLNVSVGAGAFISSDVIIAGNTNIGMFSLIYHFSFIAHDCNLGDFVQIAAGTKIMGRCNIGHKVMIGPNVTINPGVKIGSNTQIGAGSVVTKDIPENCIAFGVPARIVSTKDKISEG